MPRIYGSKIGKIKFRANTYYFTALCRWHCFLSAVYIFLIFLRAPGSNRERKDSEEVEGGEDTDATTTPSQNKKVLRRTLEGGGATVEKEAEINNSAPPLGVERGGALRNF